MIDSCEVYYLGPGDKAMEKLSASDPLRHLMIEELVHQIEENGWTLSVKSQLIKVLRPKERIGEIRDMGKGGHRLFFFWVETPSSRKLYITSLPKKKDVTGRQRLKTFLDAVESARDRFLKSKG
jgi:hypothetical protein